MPFGTFPAPAGYVDEGDIALAKYTSASSGKVAPGTIVGYKTVAGVGEKWSFVKFVQFASATYKGAPVIVHASASIDPNVVYPASISDGGRFAAGIAAASMAASEYGWIYIYGYCPGARVATALASGALLTTGGTNAAANYLGEATIAATSGSIKMGFAINHWANADVATLSSITIQTWLG